MNWQRNRTSVSIFFTVTFFLLCINLSGASIDFFNAAPDKGLSLPKDKLYPAGQVFLLSGYSPHPRSFEQIKQSGFTALGPVYGGRDDILLAQCKAMKIFCIYAVRAKSKDGLLINKKTFKDRKRKFDWSAVRASIAKAVNKVKSEKTVCMWYIYPEELRWWRKNELRYLKEAYKTIRKTDPEKRPVWQYSPGHYTSGSLKKLALYQDVIGKASYTNYSGMEKQRIWVKWSIEQELETIKKYNNKSQIPILVPELYQDPASPEKVRDYVRHDIYLGLISGAKGIIIYSLFRRRNLTKYQDYLDSYCEVASELMKRQKLHRYFLFGTPKQDLQMTIINGPKKIDLVFMKNPKKSYSTINFANIALGSKRLLVVVNSALQKTSVKFSGFPKNTFSTIDAFIGKPAMGPSNGTLKIDLKPFEVKAFIFSNNTPK
jgi:hypothetical protein